MPAEKSNKAPPIAAFVSYAKADQEKAKEIADSLEERGFPCWIAPRDVRPGRSYGDEIIRGIEAARSLILVLSSASNGSGFVSREIERAVSKNKPIFTIRVEDVQPAPALELFISSTQWIDAFKGRLGPQIDRLAEFLVEDEGADHTPGTSQGIMRPAQSRPAWRSPLLLGGAGALALAAIVLGTVWLLRPGIDPKLEREACLNFSGDVAIAACDRAIASGKFTGRELASLYGTRGLQKQLVQDSAGALADYDEAIERDPANYAAFNNRGLVYRDTGDYDRAVADFSRAIELRPWPDPYASRGWIYLQQGDNERAVQDIEKALALNPTPELKAKLEATLDQAKGQAQPPVPADVFGPDTRKSLSAFPEEERKQLEDRYGYVGTLVGDGAAFCNATLVGANLILTAKYCLDRRYQTTTFRILDRDGKLLKSAIAHIVSDPLRGMPASQRVAVLALEEPLGEQAGWVKTVGGEPAVGDRLDIVAIDIGPGASGPANPTVAGAATNDPNCVVLARDKGADMFVHRCIMPDGSGGAPIFEADTGALVGIVGEIKNRIVYAYWTGAVPGLIKQAASN